MRPSERIEAAVHDYHASKPGIPCYGPLTASESDRARLFEIAKILDEWATGAVLPDFLKAPGLFYETLVLKLDGMPPRNRATFLALLSERYLPNGERR